jgi:hypothetical protein
MYEEIFSVLTPVQITLIVVLVLFEAVLKLIALWKSANNHQKYWFVFMFFLNTAGILPLIYIKFFQKKR